jgi:hypothetical protein
LNAANAQLEAANERLETASQTDQLTGLRNRRYLVNQIPADLSFYDREQKRSGRCDHALLFALVDVDHFKRINDTYGHKAGDELLQQFSERMTRLVRTGDYVVRWGWRGIPAGVPADSARGNHHPGRTHPPLRRRPGLRHRRAGLDHLFDWPGRVPAVSPAATSRWAGSRCSSSQTPRCTGSSENGRDGWATLRPTPETDMDTLMSRIRSGAQKLIANRQLELVSSKSEATV